MGNLSLSLYRAVIYLQPLRTFWTQPKAHRMEKCNVLVKSAGSAWKFRHPIKQGGSNRGGRGPPIFWLTCSVTVTSSKLWRHSHYRLTPQCKFRCYLPGWAQPPTLRPFPEGRLHDGQKAWQKSAQQEKQAVSNGWQCCRKRDHELNLTWAYQCKIYLNK